MTTETIQYLEARIQTLDAAYKRVKEERDLAFSALCTKFTYIEEEETKVDLAVRAMRLEQEYGNLIKFPEYVSNEEDL
jgi:hypothetical protein